LRVGRYSDFWLQVYRPAFSIWMAIGLSYPVTAAPLLPNLTAFPAPTRFLLKN